MLLGTLHPLLTLPTWPSYLLGWKNLSIPSQNPAPEAPSLLSSGTLKTEPEWCQALPVAAGPSATTGSHPHSQGKIVKDPK